MKLLFFPIVPWIRKNSTLYQGFQASAACLYDKSSAKLKFRMERGLSVTNRKKNDVFGENLSRWHTRLQTSHWWGLKTRLRHERPASWCTHLKNEINLNYL
jgi:hypothetical protein